MLGAALAAALPAWAAAPRLQVVASFSILADMVRQIGGDAVEVASLVGPDGDAHVFEPTPQHARALQQARVLVVNGLGFEGWMPRLKKSAGFKGLEVVASRGVKPRHFAHAAHEHGRHRHHGDEHDPHAWQNVKNAVVYAGNIADGLAQADPARAAHYRARGADYAARLSALDARIRQTLAALPAGRRSVVTTHDAFGYYADAYGLRFVPARGLSTESEPSARELAALIEQVRRERIPAIFVENIADPRLLEQLARETGAVIGGQLYSDALSPPGGPAATYAEMMEANTAALAQALAAR
ncbi:MAG: metal ABC transporter substrate-binding protein [Ottowia sp.]|uniref:metal ABC transporter substrate-binding protein n=1 Tax=Ottowia sp. TaxID=1898956 RepID=UPI0039E657FF